MIEVAIVQPIFAPDKKRLDRNIASLESISSYFDAYPYSNLVFNFGGWAREEYWPEISSFIAKAFTGKKYVVKKFNKNYGKAKVVNTLMASIETDYVLTADSDIIFLQDQPDMIQRLIACAEECNMIRDLPFGVIGINQQGESHHRPKVFEIEHEYGNEKISWGEKLDDGDNPCEPASHIAGGCLFFSTEMWHHLGGYSVMNVYAGEDTHFMLSVCENDFSWQLLQTLYIYHPEENDPIYTKWKENMAYNNNTTKKKLTKRDVAMVEKFWSEHGKEH